jgi:hypothetical protein
MSAGRFHNRMTGCSRSHPSIDTPAVSQRAGQHPQAVPMTEHGHVADSVAQ